MGPVDLFSWIHLFVVGTDRRHHNAFHLELSTHAVREIPDSLGEESVAVATYRFYDFESLQFVFAFCFANANQKNRCYRYIIRDDQLKITQKIPDLSNLRGGTSHRFGHPDEVTSDIKLFGLNRDGNVDVLTIELGGHVRYYRGTAYTEATFDFSSVMPEALDSSSSRAPHPLRSLSRQLFAKLSPRRKLAVNPRLPYSVFSGGSDGMERFLIGRSRLVVGTVAFARTQFLSHPIWTDSSANGFYARSLTDYPAASKSLFRGLYKTSHDTDVRFIIVHHSTGASGSEQKSTASCTMQCASQNRLGFDSLTLYDHRAVTSLDEDEKEFYYTSGTPNQCLCGPKRDVFV